MSRNDSESDSSSPDPDPDLGQPRPDQQVDGVAHLLTTRGVDLVVGEDYGIGLAMDIRDAAVLVLDREIEPQPALGSVIDRQQGDRAQWHADQDR